MEQHRENWDDYVREYGQWMQEMGFLEVTGSGKDELWSITPLGKMIHVGMRPHQPHEPLWEDVGDLFDSLIELGLIEENDDSKGPRFKLSMIGELVHGLGMDDPSVPYDTYKDLLNILEVLGRSGVIRKTETEDVGVG